MKQPVGVLKRLNVGVVLDDWQKVDADGKTTSAPMSDTDIKRFTQLVQANRSGSRRIAATSSTC